MKLLETLMRPIGDVRTIKALLTGAENEALRDGQTTPGAEHLFLSALALPEGSARRAFARIGIDPDGLRAAITAQHVEALGAIGIDAAPEDSDRGVEIPAPGKGVFRATDGFAVAFRGAGELARSMKSPLLGAHVVAVIAQMEHGTTPRALRAMGIVLPMLESSARSELTSTG